MVWLRATRRPGVRPRPGGYEIPVNVHPTRRGWRFQLLIVRRLTLAAISRATDRHGPDLLPEAFVAADEATGGHQHRVVTGRCVPHPPQDQERQHGQAHPRA